MLINRSPIQLPVYPWLKLIEFFLMFRSPAFGAHLRRSPRHVLGGEHVAETLKGKGSSLACGLPPPNTRREDGCGTAQGRSSADLRPPPKPAARSRLIIGDFGPSDSALAAARGWRLRRAGAARHAARYASRDLCSGGAPRRYSPSRGSRRVNGNTRNSPCEKRVGTRLSLQ